MNKICVGLSENAQKMRHYILCFIHFILLLYFVCHWLAGWRWSQLATVGDKNIPIIYSFVLLIHRTVGYRCDLISCLAHTLKSLIRTVAVAFVQPVICLVLLLCDFLLHMFSAAFARTRQNKLLMGKYSFSIRIWKKRTQTGTHLRQGCRRVWCLYEIDWVHDDIWYVGQRIIWVGRFCRLIHDRSPCVCEYARGNAKRGFHHRYLMPTASVLYTSQR